MKHAHRRRWRPRSGGLVFLGALFVMIGSIGGLDYFFSGIDATGLVSTGLPLAGPHLLVASVLFVISGVAMIASGARHAEPDAKC
ncbi:MAG TPA: hypothetical protein VFY49_11015 [Myxococcota bacterium]|nr:hypothetical protein [Myxococcota bacterium]